MLFYLYGEDFGLKDFFRDILWNISYDINDRLDRWYLRNKHNFDSVNRWDMKHVTWRRAITAVFLFEASAAFYTHFISPALFGFGVSSACSIVIGIEWVYLEVVAHRKHSKVVMEAA